MSTDSIVSFHNHDSILFIDFLRINKIGLAE